jgi:hypothetical protein
MLFRPDDTKPLAEDEDREWFEMETMGRGRYIVRRTASMLAQVVLPVVGLSWSVWWASPGARELLFGRVTWIGLGIGTVLVGSLSAAHGWDTWRSYERRSAIDDTMAPIERAAVAMDRAVRYGLIGATIGTGLAVFAMFSHQPWWATAIYVASALAGWRFVLAGRRAQKVFQRVQDTTK